MSQWWSLEYITSQLLVLSLGAHPSVTQQDHVTLAVTRRAFHLGGWFKATSELTQPRELSFQLGSGSYLGGVATAVPFLQVFPFGNRTGRFCYPWVTSRSLSDCPPVHRVWNRDFWLFSKSSFIVGIEEQGINSAKNSKRSYVTSHCDYSEKGQHLLIMLFYD